MHPNDVAERRILRFAVAFALFGAAAGFAWNRALGERVDAVVVALVPVVRDATNPGGNDTSYETPMPVLRVGEGPAAAEHVAANAYLFAIPAAGDRVTARLVGDALVVDDLGNDLLRAGLGAFFGLLCVGPLLLREAFRARR